jgi:hypothetical protein
VTGLFLLVGCLGPLDQGVWGFLLVEQRILTLITQPEKPVKDGPLSCLQVRLLFSKCKQCLTKQIPSGDEVGI